jgi:hypothetical protein
MDWVVSIGSAIVLWMYGNKYRFAPVAGMIMQAMWCVFAYTDNHTGFYPLAVVFAAVHYRNFRKWNTL